MAKELEKLSKNLDSLIKMKREQKSSEDKTETASILGTVIAGVLTPILEEMKSSQGETREMVEKALREANLASQRQSEDNARALTEISETLKNIKPEVTVNPPEVRVPEFRIPEIKIPDINIPEIKSPDVIMPEISLPEINVPEPKVTVNVPEQNIEFPERFKVDFDRIDRKFPMPILAVDEKGQPVNFGGSHSGGKADFFTIKDIKKDNTSLIDSSYRLNTAVTAADSYSIDAFGRWRVSNPQTLFDSKQIFNDSDLADSVENYPLFYDNQETSGAGTSTTFNPNESSTTLSVSATTAGTRIRQTKMRFNYQPGKSILVLMTYALNSQVAGITQREGIFDENNGLFLEDDGTDYKFVRRTGTSGSPVDNEVIQDNWNLDTMDGTGPSGIALDFTKTQILYIDYEWLGVGRVRMGFVINGIVYYAHEFNNANKLSVVYMQTPNLPLRSEISNDGTGPAASMDQICSTVISEGGQNDLGILRFASTEGTHCDLPAEDTEYAVLGIRLKSNYIGESIKLVNTALQLQTASHKVQWSLKLNPTVEGTFTYADESLSAVQIARGATNTVTGGYNLDGGFLESGGVAAGGAGSIGQQQENAILLGSLIDGTVDEMVLCARPVGGSTSVDIEGGISWRELS